MMVELKHTKETLKRYLNNANVVILFFFEVVKKFLLAHLTNRPYDFGPVSRCKIVHGR
jgi:hypothetical protein